MPELQLKASTRVARFGDFHLDFGKMELWRADEQVALTVQEFRVLKFFVSRPEVVLSRPKLITAVWPKRKRSSHRTVDNCIAKLRQKIEMDPAKPVYLLTVHGAGYKFVPHEKHRPLWQDTFETAAEPRTLPD